MSLKPCPFCGGDAATNNHREDCYFVVHSKISDQSDGDLSNIPELAEAWNLRSAEPAQPVAWMYVENGETYFGHPDGYHPSDARPLYTSPQPMSDEEIIRQWDIANFDNEAVMKQDVRIAFARAVRGER